MTTSPAAALPTLDRRPIRRVLERRIGGGWHGEAFGPAGVRLLHPGSRSSVIVTIGEYDGTSWRHASWAHPDVLPTYDELRVLKEAAWGPDGYAYQVFPAAAEHVSIHDHALHLWGRDDGAPALPQFGAWGSI